MPKKNKQKYQSISTGTVPWWKRAWAKFALFPFGALLTIVAFVALGYNYKNTNANELSKDVYQPLHADLKKVETAINAISLDDFPPDQALAELTRTGAIDRIPSALRSRVVSVFREATDTYMSALEVKEIVIREMSSRIMKIRTEEMDKVWHEKTSQVIRVTPTSKKKGISDTMTMVEGVTHDSISQVFDRNFVPVGPGGPIFTIRDWLGYPESIKTIEPLWKEVDYLHFHPNLSHWYYKLTREDLKRIDTSLELYLKPVHDVLKENPDFKRLLTQRPILLSEIAAIKDALTDRVRDPKQMRDLWD